MCANHPKILTPQKLRSPLGLFGLKNFHGFVILAERMYPTSCIAICLNIKMWEVLACEVFTKNHIEHDQQQ